MALRCTQLKHTVAHFAQVPLRAHVADSLASTILRNKGLENDRGYNMSYIQVRRYHQDCCADSIVGVNTGRHRGLQQSGLGRSRRESLSTSAEFKAPGVPPTDESTDGSDARQGVSSAAEDEDEDGDFDDPRIAILDAALDHVHQHGFHSITAGMFPNEGAELVYHVMAKALDEVKDLSAERKEKEQETEVGEGGKHRFDWDESQHGSSETEKLRAGLKAALSTIEPYKSHWPQAMGIGALPQNAGATTKKVAVLADELAFLSGDRSTDLAWYAKRGLIGGIYTSTELFMLTDKSEGLSDTWAFLDRRLADYETLSSSPDNAADVVTGVSTVATSLSSAVVSLAGPFLRQASKQVPGGQTLAEAAPTAAALASQAFNLVASSIPHGGSTSSSSGQTPTPAADSSSATVPTATSDQPVTFAGAPERDPWIDRTTQAGGGASSPGKFEEELAREEEELFGVEEGESGKQGGRSP